MQMQATPIADKALKIMSGMPQAEFKTAHYFGPGIYIREVTLPAGILAVGHKQKLEQLNVVISGKVAMFGEDGKVHVVTAPTIFTAAAGRKFGYVIEETVWQNIYATDETDLDKLENMFIDKSDMANYIDEITEIDRADYLLMLQETGFSQETVTAQTTNKIDQIEMPEPFKDVATVKPSLIEGVGLFINKSIAENTIVAPARINGMRTPAGRFVNHSKNPNCRMVKDENGTINLVSIQAINCIADDNYHNELTIDYRQAISLTRGEQCQA
jgi:hypothetical protein